MANQIKIDLSLTGEQATARGLDNVGDKAEQAGDDLQKMARDAAFLDKRLAELRGGTKALAAQFAVTGDKDIFKMFQGSKRELGQLEGIKKLLDGVGSAGGKAGGRFGEEFTKGLMALRGPMIGVLVGAAAAATPFLSGVISSALVGGLGVGGIVGGIALAAKDARVQEAGAELARRASEAFGKSAEPFVKPVIQAMEMLDGEIDGIAASLRDAFSGVGPALIPLAKGLTGLVKEMMPGLVSALNSARPVLITIGEELPKIGRAIGDFFRIISKDPRGAIMAFQDLSRIMQGAIVLTGRFLAAMSILWAKISPILQAAQGDAVGAAVSIAAMDAALEEANRLAMDASGGFNTLGESANEAKNKLMALNSALDQFFGVAMNSSQATIAYERAWDEMIETLTKGKRTLDLSTEAGRENMESINATIQGIQEMHQARVDEGMGIEDSLAIRDRELEKLRKQLIQLGYNKQTIDDIINLYKLMPELASTTVEAPGAETTLAQLREMLSLINAIKGGVALGALGGVKVGGKRAAGGPVLAGQTYLVGEQGPELLTMGSANGNVTNAVKTAAAMSGASGGASRPQVTITYVPSGNAAMDAFIQAIWPSFLKQVRIDGGDLSVFGAA